MVFDAVAEVSPKRVLEVGCGMGQLAERMHVELDAEVVAIDQSERMVELTRKRGVDARVADVQELPFDDGEFDVVVAAWMLYHVPDVERALDEIVRVLRPAGRLVTATNRPEHLKELRALVGVTRTGLEGFDVDVAQRLCHLASRTSRSATPQARSRLPIATPSPPTCNRRSACSAMWARSPSWTALSSSRGGR